MNHRFLLSSAFASCLILAAASPAFSAVGVVEYVDGTVSLTRAGQVRDGIEIGDDIENFDLLKTGGDGSLVIALDAATGMRGSLTMKPNSVFSVKTETVKGAPATETDMIAGAVSVKVKKIAGTPSFSIRTSATVMGVRGTEFEVVLSLNDAVLVGCSEGRVACVGDEGDELDAVPGQSVTRRAGERLKRVPVAVSDLETFRKEWIADEIGVFKAAPLRAIDQYATLYRRMKTDFLKAFSPLANDEGLALWSSEHKRGVVPRANDIAVMRQKSAIVPKLMAVRRVLFLFERIYYRLEDIREQVGVGTLRDRELSSGGTVGDFYNQFSVDKRQLERMAAAYRYALLLYAERNEGRDLSMGDDGGDFFDDTSSFFD